MAVCEWSGLRTKNEERELKQWYQERIDTIREEIEGIESRYTKPVAVAMGFGYGVVLAFSRVFDPSMLPLGIVAATAIEAGMIVHDANRIQSLDNREFNLRWRAKAASIWLDEEDNT